jgi:hypothetical protein
MGIQKKWRLVREDNSVVSVHVHKYVLLSKSPTNRRKWGVAMTKNVKCVAISYVEAKTMSFSRTGES